MFLNIFERLRPTHAYFSVPLTGYLFVSNRISELSFGIFILDKYMIFHETYTSTGISSVVIVFFFLFVCFLSLPGWYCIWETKCSICFGSFWHCADKHVSFYDLSIFFLIFNQTLESSERTAFCENRGCSNNEPLVWNLLYTYTCNINMLI